MESTSANNLENTPRRTPILWILSIFTMLNTFFSTISYVAWAVNADVMQKSLEIMKKVETFSEEQVDQIVGIYSSISSWQYFLLAIIQLIIFAGAFIMLSKLNKIGFHFYTIGQILQFCVLNFVIGGVVAMGTNAIVTTILWVLMYSTQLRFMRKVEE